MSDKPTVERLREVLNYDCVTGVFTRRVAYRGEPVGTVVAQQRARGYVAVSADGHRIFGQIAAWAHHTGAWPTGRITMVNLDRADHRIENLVELFKSDGVSIVSHERLLELLSYNPDTGEFVWRKYKGSHAGAGDIAGASAIKGRYSSIAIDQRPYLAHRLAWFYAYGVWPEFEIDHKDGDGKNNCLSNLRDVPHVINMQNIRVAKKMSRSCELMGVSMAATPGKFTAGLTAFGKHIHVGTFETEEAAHLAYLQAKRLHHPGCTI